MKKRGSGILLHVSSLPSPYGIGDLGPEARRFVDFLYQAGQSLWQILPLTPTDTAFGNSPYHGLSAFAGNPILISPELLVEDGFLAEKDLKPAPDFPHDTVDYGAVTEYKRVLLHKAYWRFKKRKRDHEYERFCRENSHWLDDFALFMALKAHFGGRIWSEWPQELRDRRPEALYSFNKRFRERIRRGRFVQHLFFKQWSRLKSYCREKGVQLIGDLPIYVSYDSSDVWAHPEIFKLNEEKKPWVVAGVPPDYFSETGQRWGNPVYKWDALRETGYAWWMERMEHNLKLFDTIRIDHFRGFVAYWEVQAHEETAMNGAWVEAPADDFFNALLKRFPYLPVIAEDLGVITPDVRETLMRFEFPGMRVLLFAFGEDKPMHPYLPHTYPKNCVAYTGTHDTNTIRGWFDKEAGPEEKRRLFAYLGCQAPEEIHWELIRLAMMSVADTVIIPLQDILGLSDEARMNLPAAREGNWRWRFLPHQLTEPLSARLKEMTEIYGRA